MDPPHERSPGPSHARPDLRGHHDRIPDGVHADGNGCLFRLARLPKRESGARQPAGPRSVRAANLWRHVERRTDRDSAVPLHGLSRRTGEADRPTIPQPASRHGARAGRTRRRNDRDLLHLCHGHRHRRRLRDADGTAGTAGDAEGRLQRQGRGGCDYCGRLPRHSDSAVGAADRLRCGGGRVGGAAVRRCVPARIHARRSLYRVHHRARKIAARSDAAAQGERAAGRTARIREGAGAAGQQRIHGARALAWSAAPMRALQSARRLASC